VKCFNFTTMNVNSFNYFLYTILGVFVLGFLLFLYAKWDEKRATKKYTKNFNKKLTKSNRKK